MSSLVAQLQVLVAFAAITFFVCMAIVSINFFVVADRSSEMGKQVISVTAGATSLLVSWLLIAQPLSSIWNLTFSLLMYLSALVVFLWTWRSNHSLPFDFVFSSREPQRISKTGPYRWVRHPFYSSYCTSWVASILGTMSPVVATLGLALIGAYVFAAIREERQFARSPLAAEYAAYKSQTGMLFPRVRRRTVAA